MRLQNMPELPEVETIKNALVKAIKGAKILNTEVFCRKFRVQIPDGFEQQTKNCTINDIKRIAKYIVVDLDNGRSLIWHLGMSGKIKICESIPDNLQKHDHVVFHTDKGIIIFNDARRFGMLDITESAKLNAYPAFRKIGIDPFDKNLTSAFLISELRRIHKSKFSLSYLAELINFSLNPKATFEQIIQDKSLQNIIKIMISRIKHPNLCTLLQLYRFHPTFGARLLVFHLLF